MSFTFDPTKAFGDPDPPDIPEDTSVLRDKVARFFRDHGIKRRSFRHSGKLGRGSCPSIPLPGWAAEFQI